MGLESFSTNLDILESDVPLVGRSREMAQLRASIAAGRRLVFVVEEDPGAGGMRLIREYASAFYEGVHLFNLSEALVRGYPDTRALADVLNEVPWHDDGILVFKGAVPLLTVDSVFDDKGTKGPLIIAEILRSTLRRSPGLKVVVCCTAAEYGDHVQGTSLERGTARIMISSLGEDETRVVLEMIVTKRWPMLSISPGAMRGAVIEGSRDKSSALPGAALELLTRAVVWAMAEQHEVVREGDVMVAARLPEQVAPPESFCLEEPKKGLNLVVLPSHTVIQVKDLIATAKARPTLARWGFTSDLLGHSAAALFHGPPGTGKSLTAEAVALELGLPICRVDGAGALSKWIGESEKTIQRIFRYASSGQAMLLIDEADALISRRTSVEHASDRHGNGVVNQLLQEIERFDGVVILTTNSEEMLDPALRRRLCYHIQFEMPDQAARTRIWRTLIPKTAPLCPDVDLTALGREFELSGGLIQNALVRAAIRAARCPSSSATITMGMLREAAREQLGSSRRGRDVGFVRPAAVHPRLQNIGPDDR